MTTPPPRTPEQIRREIRDARSVLRSTLICAVAVGALTVFAIAAATIDPSAAAVFAVAVGAAATAVLAVLYRDLRPKLRAVSDRLSVELRATEPLSPGRSG